MGRGPPRAGTGFEVQGGSTLAVVLARDFGRGSWNTPVAVPHTPYLGRRVGLTIVRFGAPGAFLGPRADSDKLTFPPVLLPRLEVPHEAKEGDEIDVVLYLDSEDRPIATTRQPKLLLGEVAFLEVTDLTSFGAFVDWGLPKDLLVPLKEQTRRVVLGERHPIALYLDDSGRLAGTMRVSEMLDDPPHYEVDEWVDGEAWRKDGEVGIFVILEKRFVSLVPGYEPCPLVRGQAAKFRVANVLPDGKLELSLRGHAHQEVEADAAKLLALLGDAACVRIGDGTDPVRVRSLLGYSKKALKRAAGRLLKQRLIRVDRDGTYRIVAETAARATDPER